LELVPLIASAPREPPDEIRMAKSAQFAHSMHE